MSSKTTFKVGDKCPLCGGELNTVTKSGYEYKDLTCLDCFLEPNSVDFQEMIGEMGLENAVIEEKVSGKLAGAELVEEWDEAANYARKTLQKARDDWEKMDKEMEQLKRRIRNQERLISNVKYDLVRWNLEE